jgi:hypothetical protein
MMIAQHQAHARRAKNFCEREQIALDLLLASRNIDVERLLITVVRQVQTRF